MMTGNPKKWLWTLCALMLGSVLLACLLGPHVFNLLVFTGRSIPALQGLRGLEMEGVVSRLTLIILVIGFYPAFRYAVGTQGRELGLDGSVPWRMEILRGWLFGVVSVALLFGVGLAVGAYTWAPGDAGSMLGRMAGFLVGGLLIGFIEEIFFRGALFNAARRVAGFIPGALVVSVFFALIHFIGPVAPEGVVHGHWNSGLLLLPHLFERTSDLWHYLPFGITLFVMSLVLCVRLARDGHLFYIIGLHAGWVMLLGGGRYLIDRVDGVWPFWFGASENVARSPMALLLMLGLLVWFGWDARRKGRA